VRTATGVVGQFHIALLRVSLITLSSLAKFVLDRRTVDISRRKGFLFFRTRCMRIISKYDAKSVARLSTFLLTANVMCVSFVALRTTLAEAGILVGHGNAVI